LKKTLNGYRCYECNSEYRLKYNCPKQKKKLADKEDKSAGGNKSGCAGDNKSAEWKFIAPANENARIMVNGLEYFYCKHCICNNTQRKGFFNRTHTSTATATTLGHTFPRSDDANTATADETASL